MQMRTKVIDRFASHGDWLVLFTVAASGFLIDWWVSYDDPPDRYDIAVAELVAERKFRQFVEDQSWSR